MVDVAPRSIRLAAVAVALEGIVLLVAAVVLVSTGQVAVSVWGFVVLLGAGVTAAGVALARGVRGARGPCLVAQLLLLGIDFYAAVPSGRPEWGLPAALVAAVVIAGLLSRAGRDWAES